MLQCNGCTQFINPERGQQLKVGLRRIVRDRHGNEIIAEIQCQDCVNGVPELSDQAAVGASVT